MTAYRITVREIGGGVVLSERIDVPDLAAAGRVLGDIWLPPYSTSPGRYRATLREVGSRRVLQTID